jgi:hypothetical protein
MTSKTYRTLDKVLMGLAAVGWWWLLVYLGTP